MAKDSRLSEKPRTTKPRIFLACSSEARDWANALSLLMSQGNWALVKPWYYSTEPGKPILAALTENTGDVQFAVVLYTGDDTTISRGVSTQSPRDNVVFELGFFIARLGPERVVLVSPNKVPKIPSNYTGYLALTFDPSFGEPSEFFIPVAQQLETRFKQELQAVSESKNQHTDLNTGLGDVDSVNTVDIVYKPSLGGIIPIYRDLSSPIDWFIELESNLKPPFRYLNSKLVYYGPGLAKYWIQSSRKDAANQAMIGLLKNNLEELLGQYLAESINVIDLGIGDFEKGHIVLDFFLDAREVRTINYFPLDVSYEMLVQALRTREDYSSAKTLRAVQRTGSITAINATFSQLDRYKHLLTPPSRNIFLLLGNTLGNESVEIQTLTEIAAGMDPGDLLLTEVQLTEENTPTIEEDNKAIQEHKEFYTGPFRVLGYDSHNIDLTIRTNPAADQARGIAAVTYEVMCRLKKPLSARHPAFAEEKISVRAGEQVCVYLIRLYLEEALESFLDQAGFDVLVSRVMRAPDSKPPRRFQYVLAQKRG